MTLQTILSRIRQYFPDVQDLQIQEIATMLVEFESETQDKMRINHQINIDNAISKSFKDGENLGRELERRNFLGWEND